ncbi:MAG: diaminopimelate epimerase [Polyangiaceae bacterium]
MTAAKVPFEKWEGLGNDFVLVEQDPFDWSDQRVRAVCDRRRGVGADGVLFVGRGSPAKLPSMVVRNADGSRPEMCGNGIRCVAGYLTSHVKKAAGVVSIASDAGTKRCDVSVTGGGYEVSVDMGPARIDGKLAVEIDRRVHTFTFVDVGNPHAITFDPYEESEIDRVGPRVSRHPEGGTNVEFCRVVRGDEPRVDVIVWERGVGRTLACGTGACAVASAACEAGFFPYGAPVRVRLPGGDLSITVERGSWAATMRGPARRVFSGELETP